MADAILRIKAVMENSDVISNINQIQNRLESLKMPKDLTDRTKSKFEELTGLVKEYQNLMDKPHKSNADLRRLDQLNVQIKKIEKEAEKMIRSFDFSKIDTSEIDSAAIQKLNHELDETHKKIAQITKNSFDVKPGKGMDSLLSKIKEIQKIAESKNSNKTKNLFKDLTEGINTGDIDKITKAIRGLDQYLKPGAFKGAEDILKPFKEGNISENIHRIVDELQKTDSEFMQTAHSAEQLEDAIKAELANRLTEMAKEANQVGDGFRDASNAAEAYRNSVTHAAKQQSEMQMQVQNLQQQVKNYFGLDEIFRKIGDLARSAMDTVKELDAAMTETAVVTNFDVSDMWKMLPTYTKNANQLGSTIADVYNAATLYYQQGLTTTQSMALANETLKMARIGGIEAAEATDMMTAALRGFNMEINEASAQRINDVYSKLAAITAADTKEIGTAMERTASISKSANMDFETTSAFLAQMIETTREAPENLGTAMKTIVARFQEMKVDPNTLIDSEGERLDFNRVDKALKSVGISLVDQQNQFRNLDDVFLEISSRWDGMTQAQQRYIATIAAGSRQQSRFIAMMQDYDRTMELVDAAYTAEGAGQAQFEKTLESMDSKLNRLKNAWDLFAMGFMNADFLKVGVDAGTKFLDIFEKIITGISQIGVVDPFKSIIKSALTATAVFGGLLAMSRLLMAGIGKFAGMVLGEGVAKEATGIVGMGAKMVYGEDNSDKAIKRKQRQQRLKDQREEMQTLGKESAKMRQKIALDSMRGNQEGYFSNIKAGNKSKKEFKAFQKDLQKNMSSEGLSFDAFNQSFSKIGDATQKAILQNSNISESISNAFRRSIESSDMAPIAKQQAMDYINALEQALNAGQIDFNTFKSNLESQLDAGVLEDLGKVNLTNEEVGNVAPLANLSANFDKVGGAAMSAGSSIQMFAANLQGTPLAPFGNALMLVGQGLENIGMLATSGINFIKKFATSMKVAGGAAIGMSAAEATAATGLKAVELGIRGIGASIMTAMPYVLAIAAAIGAIYGLYMAVSASSRAFERQGDAAAQASQDLDTTKQALEAVTNDLEELTNNDTELDGLVKGTTEWSNALAEANAHIIEMMQNYKALNEIGENGQYKYVTTDEDGRMSITKAGQEAIKKEYENAVNIATANNAVQGALYNNLKDLRSKEYTESQALISRTNRVGAGGTSKDSDEYKQAVLLTENVRKANAAREENAWKTGIHAAINDLNLPNQETVETILTGQREAYTQANKLGITLGKREELETEYADLMGYVRTDKDTYKDAQGNELTIDFSTVKEMLPELRSISQMQERADDVAKAASTMDSTFNQFDKEGLFDDKLLSNIMADSTKANADEISKLLKEDDNGKSQLDKFIEDQRIEESEFTNEAARQLENLVGAEEGSITSAKKFNKALDTYADSIEEKGKALEQQGEDNRSAVAGLYTAAGVTNIKDVDKYTYEEMEKIANIADGMGDNLGQTAAYQLATTLAEAGEKGRTDIENALSGIDFSNSLQVVDAFKGLENNKNIDSAAQAYGEAFVNSFEYAEQSALALQQVVTSDDLAEAMKDVDGALDAKKVQQLTESSASLKTYLDATGMSASAFAKILNGLNDADLDISSLTPGLVAFANAMDQVGNATGIAAKAIEGFDAGFDTGSIDEFAKSSKEAIDEMITNGEYGNEQLKGYFDFFFEGDKSFDKIATDKGSYKKAAEKLNKELNEILLDSGEFDTDKLMEKFIGDPSKFEGTTKDLVQAIRDEWDLTEEAANSALSAMINKSENLGLILQKNDSKGAYDELQNTGKQLGEKYAPGEGKTITSASDLINISSILDEEESKNFWKRVNEDYGPVGTELQKLTEQYTKGELELDQYHEKVTDTIQAAQKEGTVPEGMITTTVTSSNEEIAKEVGRVFYSGGDPLQTLEDGAIDLSAAAETFTMAAGDQTRGYEALEAYIREGGHEQDTFEYEGQQITGQEILEKGLADTITGFQEGAQWVTVGETIGAAIVEYLKNPNKEEQEAKEKEIQAAKEARERQTTLRTEKNQANAKVAESSKETQTAYTKDGIDDNNKLDVANLNNLIKGVQTDIQGRQNQNLVIGQYLQNNSKQLLDQGASSKEIASSITQAAQQMADNKMEPADIAAAINQGYGTHLTEGDVTTKDGKVDVNLEQQNLQEQLKQLHADIEATIKVTSITGMGFSAKASGQNNHRFGTFARGSKRGYTIPGRPTLTGEEGEELVWEPKRNQAYMVGSNGPQFANISRDAVVWNAEQTRRIKKNSGSVGAFGLGAKGINYFGTMGGGSHGGGAKGGGKSIGGSITLDATANITEANPAGIEPVPVKGKLEIDSGQKGGLQGILNKLGIGGKEQSHTIKVTAKVTSVTPPEEPAPIKGTATVDKVNPVKKRVKGIKGTAVVDKVSKSGKLKGEPVKVKAQATVNSVTDTSKAQGAVDDLASSASSTQTMTVNANTGAALSKINALISKFNKTYTLKYNASGPSNISVKISPNFTGTWEKTVKINKKPATGMNYKKYNSYAKGKSYAQNSNGKGGLALTGEEGYEVVWFPKQNKSMIVGMDGPQMMQLPRDAVVWPHDQSKKIVKNNKGTPVGSFASGKKKSSVKPYMKYGVYRSEKNEVKFFNLIEKFDKLAKAIEQSELKIESWSLAIEKASDNLERATTTTTYALNTNFAKVNTQIRTQANYLSKTLSTLASELKKAKKQQAAANKSIKAVNKSRNRVRVDYNLNATKNAKSKSFTTSEGALVTRKNGRLVMNEKKINKIARKHGGNAYQVHEIEKQLREAAKSLMDEYNGNLDEAKKNLQEIKKKQYDIQKQRRELVEKIQETYYGWTNELTKLNDLKNKLDLSSSFESLISSGQSLIESQAKAGFGDINKLTEEYGNENQKYINTLKNQIIIQKDIVNANIKELEDLLTLSDNNSALAAAQKRLKALGKKSKKSPAYIRQEALVKQLQQERNEERLGRGYVETTRDSATGEYIVNFDYERLEKDRKNGLLSSKDKDAVKDYYEKVLQSIQNVNQSLSDDRSKLSEAYQKFYSEYSEVDSIAKTIIAGMEKEEEETINSLETLNRSLTDGFKDLIDSVRKELDRQRKLEQNQKTEKDISDKMNRLAMLRADTAGSNAAEIARLEKEIQDATGSYEDSLEDQLLDRLQDDADKAAEQRERQIEILQEQLEYTKAIGQYVTEAENLIKKVINGTANPEDIDRLRNYHMLGSNGKDPLTEWGKFLAAGEWDNAYIKLGTFNTTIEDLTTVIQDSIGILSEANESWNNASGGAGKLDVNSTKATAMKANNVGAQDALNMLHSQDSKLSAKGAVKAMREGGYSASELKGKTFNGKKIGLGTLVGGGFGVKALRNADYGVKQIFQALISSGKSESQAIKMMKQSGVDVKDLKGLTYTGKDGKKRSVSAKDLYNNGYSYNALAKQYGAKTLFNVAKSTKSKNDLAGTAIKTSGTTGHFSESGKVAFAQGAAVKYKDAVSGKITSTKNLSNFKESDFAKNNAERKEFVEATKYAMTHSQVGSKVPNLKNALAWAIKSGAWTSAGFNKGWALKGIEAKGSAGSSGNIYFNSKDLVKIWDPSQGTLKNSKQVQKLSKNELKERTSGKYAGREYKEAVAYYNKNRPKKAAKLTYKTGGLADYTGPAWLDGTPSKPELVLNSTDTRNFLALRDVLSKAVKTSRTTNNTYGDAVYEININVDHINSDYDVDRIAERVKKDIVKSASYRNVTQVRNFR